MAVSDQFAVLYELLFDGFEKITVFLLDEIQYRIDDILKFRDDAVACDFVKFRVETMFADRCVLIVADYLTHRNDLFQLFDVLRSEISENVNAENTFKSDTELEKKT